MGQRSGFGGGRYPSLVRIQHSSKFVLVCSKRLSPFRRGRRVCATHDVDIPIRLRIEVPQGSIPTHAHASEAFQYPSQLTRRVTTDEIQNPFTCSTSLRTQVCSRVLTRIRRK